MDLSGLSKLIEGLTAQISHLEAKIQDQGAVADQRLAAINASIQNEGRPMIQQPRRNVHRQHLRHNYMQDGYYSKVKALNSIKVEAPNFDGQLNAKVCLDWISDMDYYFDWYDLFETRRVRFAKMKLVGKARDRWSGVERRAERVGDESIIDWEKMKEKYIPLAYKECLLDQWQSLRQENMSVVEYMLPAVCIFGINSPFYSRPLRFFTRFATCRFSDLVSQVILEICLLESSFRSVEKDLPCLQRESLPTRSAPQSNQ